MKADTDSSSSNRPNIIVLCPDEMKASACGCYGNPAGATPFIDAWADKATRFEQCHTVHPKCTPSRCAFTSGQYPHINGHRTLYLPLRSGETNLIQTLIEHGYETALFGKNHTVESAEIHETFQHVEFPPGLVDFKPHPEHPEGSYYVGESNFDLDEFRDRRVTVSGCDWLKERTQDKPFFMWMNWNAPHPPYSVPAPYFGITDRSLVELPPFDTDKGKAPFQSHLRKTHKFEQVSEEQWREIAACYLDMSRFVDNQVKDVFETLEQTGQRENTIIIFWSDHGDFAGEHRLSEKWDTCFYDCLTRIPCIIDGPGVAQKEIPGLVESIDLMPTALELADVHVPETVQGKSLLPLMRGETDELRPYVFCQGGQEDQLFDRVADPDANERPARAYWYKQKALFDNPTINRRAKMIRDLNYKYCYHSGGFEELYNLQNDPHELTNCADDEAHEEILDTMRLRLVQKLVETETPEPIVEELES